MGECQGQDPRQGGNSPGPAEVDLRWQAAGGWQDFVRLQHPEGVHSSPCPQAEGRCQEEEEEELHHPQEGQAPSSSTTRWTTTARSTVCAASALPRNVVPESSWPPTSIASTAASAALPTCSTSPRTSRCLCEARYHASDLCLLSHPEILSA